MTIFTTDVSHHDWDRRSANMDWPAVKASGIDVMCAKLSEGGPGVGYQWADPRGAVMISSAKRAKLTLTGGYHCLAAGKIQAQVTWFEQLLASAGANWAMLDVEPFPELVQAGVKPRWSDVETFLDLWGQPGLAVYLPRWAWDQLGQPSLMPLKDAGAVLVSSNYGPNQALAPAPLYTVRGGDGGPGWQQYGGVAPAIWQYGSRAKVPGCSGSTDVNAYRGTVAQLAALLQGKEEDQMAADTAFQVEQIYNALFFGGNSCGDNVTVPKVNTASSGNAVFDQLRQLRQDLTALAATLGSAGEGIAAAVLAGLPVEQLADDIVGALPADLAGQVLDALRVRLES